MRYLIYSFLLFLQTMMVGIGLAQQRQITGPWKFQSIENVGLLEGQTGSAFQLQTINGVRYGSWFSGIGVGLDYYKLRSIPLFLDLRKEFGRSSNIIFIYVDGGISFSWVTDNEKMGYLNDHFSNGFYSDMGLGYKAIIGKKSALFISLGYSYKETTETFNSLYPYYSYPNYYNYPNINNIDYLNPGPQNEHINYYMNRLSIKIGWSF